MGEGKLTHECIYDWAQLQYTVQQVVIIIVLVIQTIISVQMLSTGGYEIL